MKGRSLSPRAVVALSAGLICAGLGLVVWGAWPRAAAPTQSLVTDLGELRPAMVVIPLGTYTIGSPKGEAGRDDDEPEPFEVAISAENRFAIAETEVTQAQWQAVMGSNPSYFQGERGGGPDHPVESVSYYDAVAYLNRLTELENEGRPGDEPLTACFVLSGCKGDAGAGCKGERLCSGDYTCDSVELVPGCTGYRLPTEQDWEIAARANTKDATYLGDLQIVGINNAPILDSIAWYGGNSGVKVGGYDCSDWSEKQYESNRCGAQPVGKKTPNDWTLYDLLGNVWEWTSDDYDSANKAVRGCGWNSDARNCRASIRYRYSPDWRFYYLGFRPARSWSP